MDDRYFEGSRGGFTCSSTNHPISNNSKHDAQKRRWIKRLLLGLGLPFTTLSTGSIQASANWYNTFNPIPKGTQESINGAVNSYQKFMNNVNLIIDWFKNIKENISEISINFMTWTFEFLTKTVLHTPSFLFNTEWLKSNTLTFTGLAVIMASVVVIYEGFQRMFGHLVKRKNVTDIGTIAWKVPLITTISALSPYLFYQFFNGLNWMTNFIIDIGKNQMNEGISKIDLGAVSTIEVISFVAFDIALIGMLIPILLQNFRRWFELLALSVVSPLALTCSIFKAHEHFYHTWWNSIKRKSLTQLVYSIYLVIIGTLMFGTKVPETSLDLLTKIGILIGGLYSMANPPSFLRSYVDQNNQPAGNVLKGAVKAVTPHKYLTASYSFLKGRFSKAS